MYAGERRRLVGGCSAVTPPQPIIRGSLTGGRGGGPTCRGRPPPPLDPPAHAAGGAGSRTELPPLYTVCLRD